MYNAKFKIEKYICLDINALKNANKFRVNTNFII